MTPGAVNFSNCLNRLVFTYRYFPSKSSLSDSLSNSKHNVNWNKCILVKKHDMELRGVNWIINVTETHFPAFHKTCNFLRHYCLFRTVNKSTEKNSTRNENTTQNNFFSYTFILPWTENFANHQLLRMEGKILACNRGGFGYKCHFYSRVKLL